MPASSPDRGGSPSRRCDRARPVRGPRTSAAHRTLPVKAFPPLRPPIPKGYGTLLLVRTPHDPRDVRPHRGRRVSDRGEDLAFGNPDVGRFFGGPAPASNRPTPRPTDRGRGRTVRGGLAFRPPPLLRTQAASAGTMARVRCVSPLRRVPRHRDDRILDRPTRRHRGRPLRRKEETLLRPRRQPRGPSRCAPTSQDARDVQRLALRRPLPPESVPADGPGPNPHGR